MIVIKIIGIIFLVIVLLFITEFCELLSKTKLFNYKFLGKDQKENLARIK